MKKVAVVIFNNFEEVEALCPIDILRRADAEVDVLTASDSLYVKGRSAVEVKADTLLKDVLENSYDALVISGGSGTYDVINNASLLSFIKKHFEENKIVCAICAAPLILKEAGILEGKICTGHTSIMEKLGEFALPENVVQDGNVITSRGAGTALDFSFRIVENLFGKTKAREIATSICL